MATNKIEIINNYYQRIITANKETAKKEAFKDLLNRLYSGVREIEDLIDKITMGAEATVLNIPRNYKLHSGRADTLYNNIIIEFENNLSFTYKHAKEQLAGYLLGQLRSGQGYNFTLIATDCINWKILSPDISQIDILETLNEEELILNESNTFQLNDCNSEDFYYWIDHFLFKENKQKATLLKIKESFGYSSPVFIESFKKLLKVYNELEGNGEIQVSFEQWSKFLSIAYGHFDASPKNFIIHTYLSVFSKLLAFAVISNTEFINDDEIKGVINGDVFNKLNIQNFVDNDFFHWVGNPIKFSELKKVFRIISNEISNFEFNDVDEDILKGVYQDLIDFDTKHTLGEYYTPDWLCERIVNEFNFLKTDKILDPACGSGSFLRAIIHRIKKLHPNFDIDDINNNVFGIDIHPLSVQITKTTLLLAYGKDLINAKKPIYLNIILANTLLAPEGIKTLYDNEITMQIDNDIVYFNKNIFNDVKLFDEAIELCEFLANNTINANNETFNSFEESLIKKLNYKQIDKQLIKYFYRIYEIIKSAKEKGRDSIWKFIILNLYKPYFLKNNFDYVIGNPPWFTYSSIRNGEYQNQLKTLAIHLNVKPKRVANLPHLEIAAIFLSHCSDYFLNDKGKICFVLPRSFISADHHHKTRSGEAKGYYLTQIWDLENIQPLFNIPSSVFFGQRTKDIVKFPDSGIEGILFKGNLPYMNCNLAIANEKITEEKAKWFFIEQGKASAFTNKKTISSLNESDYRKLFRQGATIVPRAFYFIDINLKYPPPDLDEDRIINIKTSKNIQSDAKTPWKEINLNERIECKFLFRTAVSKNILPFALLNPELIVLPILINNNNGYKKIELFDAWQLFNKGFRYSFAWFKQAEEHWTKNRTDRNQNITFENYLNWHNKLTSQNLNLQYLVIYSASAKDANATIVDRKKLDKEFIVDSTAYWFGTDSIDEANYLVSILNSPTPNLLMKDFQSKGSFGPRHVSKKILDIYFPKFNPEDMTHVKLAEMGENCQKKVVDYLSDNPNAQNLNGLKLGKLRLDIKKYLYNELNEIDELVKQIIKNK